MTVIYKICPDNLWRQAERDGAFTGAPVDVPAKRVPYFKPGKELKEFFTDGIGVFKK